MNVLVVDQYFYPEQFQVNDICFQMARDGHNVTVLTGLPNYPSGRIPRAYRLGRKRDEWIRGVHVLRCFEIGRRRHALGMALNYISFALSGALRQLFLPAGYDLVFIYETSPVTLALPGILYAMQRKTPVYFYCCDIWPECARVMIHDENSLPYRIITRISRYLYRRADLLAVQSEGFFDYFHTLHGIAPDKMRYLPHFGDARYLAIDSVPDENGVIDFVFTGNIGMAQDIGGLLSAVERIRDTEGFHLHLVGDGSFLSQAQAICREKHLEHLVTFYGRRPVDEMPAFYRLADVCVATLQADSLVNRTLPSKVQGYMAAGRPVLAALSSEPRHIIEENRFGICVDPGNVSQLADAMREFTLHYDRYRSFGENARRYFTEHFTFERFMDNMYQQMNELLSEARRP